MLCRRRGLLSPYQALVYQAKPGAEPYSVPDQQSSHMTTATLPTVSTLHCTALHRIASHCRRYIIKLRIFLLDQVDPRLRLDSLAFNNSIISIDPPLSPSHTPHVSSLQSALCITRSANACAHDIGCDTPVMDRCSSLPRILAMLSPSPPCSRYIRGLIMHPYMPGHR